VDDLLVGFEPECSDERDEVDAPRDGWETDFEQAFAVALTEDERTVAPTLAERFGDLNIVAVLGVVFGQDLVRCEVLACHQDALGAVDDEVAAGIDGVLADLDEFLIREALDVAVLGADHDRHPADLGFGGVDDLLGFVFATADDRHLHEDWGGVGDVAEAGLLRIQELFGAVGFTHARREDSDVAEFDVDGLLALLVADVGVDRLLFVRRPAACRGRGTR